MSGISERTLSKPKYWMKEIIHIQTSNRYAILDYDYAILFLVICMSNPSRKQKNSQIPESDSMAILHSSSSRANDTKISPNKKKKKKLHHHSVYHYHHGQMCWLDGISSKLQYNMCCVFDLLKTTLSLRHSRPLFFSTILGQFFFLKPYSDSTGYWTLYLNSRAKKNYAFNSYMNVSGRDKKALVFHKKKEKRKKKLLIVKHNIYLCSCQKAEAYVFFFLWSDLHTINRQINLKSDGRTEIAKRKKNPGIKCCRFAAL